MTIKTQLQQNNSELQYHLQDILALPNINDVKNGQYVWKKYEIDKSTEILNPKFTADFVPSRNPNLRIINKNFGMPTEATYIDFFDGFKDSSGRVFTKDGDRLKTPWGYAYTYYESQNAMHISTTSGPEQPTEFTFTGTKQITTNEQMKNYVGYIVSDNESAYPDGGEQDGFWYERVVEGVAGVDSGTITLSSSRSFSIEHSLGKVPQVFALTRPDNSGETDIVRGICYPSGGGGGETYARGVDATSGFSILYHLQIDSTKVTGTADSETKHLTGTYIWFVA